MARTVNEIKNEITAMYIANTTIQAAYGLDPAKTFDEQFSAVSIENILFYIVAFVQWTLEKLFDTHRNEMEELYSKHHAHTLEWYNTKAKAFMYGNNIQLINFTDVYDTTGLTQQQIEAAHIVTYAACTRYRQSNNKLALRLKMATGDESNRQILSPAELAAAKKYMGEIQDAGVDLQCTSTDPDYIQMTWTVYYNEQVLDNQGNRLDGSASNVVRTAIEGYIKKLPFNGTYIRAYHIDYLQQVPGIMLPIIDNAQSRSVNATSLTPIQETGETADAGWYKFYLPADLTINMQPFDYSNNVQN